MKCDWELFVVRTLSIISLDLKIFVSIKYMNEHVKRYTSARPLSPYQMRWGTQHFEIMNLLNAFCESNKEG